MRAAPRIAAAAHARRISRQVGCVALEGMNKTLPLTLTLLALSLPAMAQTTPAQPASTQASPAQATAAQPAWTQASLQAATYTVLPPTLEGHPEALNADQQKSVLTAMQHDLQGAVTRKYPNAKFVTDANTPGVIKLHPVLVVPATLAFWNSFQARVELAQSGGNAVVQDSFGVLDVFSHGANAANYLFDKLIAKLP